MTERIGIVVVNYFSAEGVAGLLASFPAHAADAEFRIAVVDNSRDAQAWAELNVVVDDAPLDRERIVTVESPENLGYAAGNNLGVARLAEWDPSVVIVINPDVRIARGQLAAVAAEVAANPGTLFGAVTARRDRPDGGLQEIRRVSGRSIELPPGEPSGAASPSRLIYPSGHFIAIGIDDWRSAGGFSDAYFLFSEEIDLALRLGASPHRVRLLTDFAVEHDSGMTTGSSSDPRVKSPVTYFHATRSRVLLFRRHGRLRRFLPTVVAARLAWAASIGLRAGPAAAADVVRGVWSGLRAERAG